MGATAKPPSSPNFLSYLAEMQLKQKGGISQSCSPKRSPHQHTHTHTGAELTTPKSPNNTSQTNNNPHKHQAKVTHSKAEHCELTLISFPASLTSFVVTFYIKTRRLLLIEAEPGSVWLQSDIIHTYPRVSTMSPEPSTTQPPFWDHRLIKQQHSSAESTSFNNQFMAIWSEDIFL